MRLDYFYNTEGENFRFYQIPGRSDRTISKAMKQLSEVGLIEKKKEDRVSRTLFM